MIHKPSGLLNLHPMYWWWRIVFARWLTYQQPGTYFQMGPSWRSCTLVLLNPPIWESIPDNLGVRLETAICGKTYNDWKRVIALFSVNSERFFNPQYRYLYFFLPCCPLLSSDYYSFSFLSIFYQKIPVSFHCDLSRHHRLTGTELETRISVYSKLCSSCTYIESSC